MPWIVHDTIPKSYWNLGGGYGIWIRIEDVPRQKKYWIVAQSHETRGDNLEWLLNQSNPVIGEQYRVRSVGNHWLYPSITTPSVTVGSGQSSTTLLLNYSDMSSYDGTLYIDKWVEPTPGVPTSISVPSIIKGGEPITISWGSGSNATSYYLERSLDGGGYAVIRDGGGTLNYVDTVPKGTTTVAYRVRAFSVGGYSGYRTSPTINVINFPEIYENYNGTFVAYEGAWENVNGTWVEIDSIWENVNGVWVKL